MRGNVIGYGLGATIPLLQLHTSIPFSLHPQENVPEISWMLQTTMARINKFLVFMITVHSIKLKTMNDESSDYRRLFIPTTKCGPLQLF
jgi:hypothetical protein